jgi:hypothetical protein
MFPTFPNPFDQSGQDHSQFPMASWYLNHPLDLKKQLTEGEV